MTLHDLSEKVRSSVDAGTKFDLTEETVALDIAIAEKGAFPADWYKAIHGLLSDEQVAKHQSAFEVVRLLSVNARYLDQRALDESLTLVKRIFALGPAWMTGFVIAEFVADDARVVDAVEWIDEQSRIQHGELLACVMHAADWIAPRLQDDKARAALSEIVRRCSTNDDKDVREEAAKALRRLKASA